MKSFLILGAGKLGSKICKYLYKQKVEIMLVDINEKKVKPLLEYVNNVQICDMTERENLATMGVDNYDACIVCVGDRFQVSLEVTDMLKELGAKYIVAEAQTDIQSKFLTRNGADYVIYPDNDVAEWFAISISRDDIFDYIELSDDYALCEISAPKKWWGKTVLQMDVRKNYSINIVAVKREGSTEGFADIDYVFNDKDHIIICGKNEDIKKLTDR